MRVVSLLPAGTEIVAALGGTGDLVGISHECDFPPAVLNLPRLTSTAIDAGRSGAAIDAEVRHLREAGRPVITIDADQLRLLRPDLIITQGLCEVCAVSGGTVFRLAETLKPEPRIVSLVARDLGGIWRDVRTVGTALDRSQQANDLVLSLQSRLRKLTALPRPERAGVLCVEWLDPLYVAGHWVPELVAAAGGVDLAALPGCHSVRRGWEEVGRLGPDHVLIMLCGFGISRARAELESVTDPRALELLGQVPTWILDGNQYTSRPGPRLVDGAERIHAALTGIFDIEVERWEPAVPGSVSSRRPLEHE